MKFDLDETMAALSCTPAALNAMLSGLPRNWVAGYFTSQCARFIKYIHQNPVRAGLVNVAEEFEYSSLNTSFTLDTLDQLPRRLKPLSTSLVHA